MTILASTLAAVAMLAALGVAALLTFLLVSQWKSNSETIRASIDLSSTAKEMTRWNQRFSELLRAQDERLNSMEQAQRAISEAIYSVPTSHRSAAKEALEKRTTASFGPPPGTVVEIPSEAESLAQKEQATTKDATPLEIVVGRPT